VAVAAHHLHPNTLLPFLPTPAGRVHWTILIGLNVVRGKCRPRRPSMVWDGMVWYGT